MARAGQFIDGSLIGELEYEGFFKRIPPFSAKAHPNEINPA